MTKYILQTARLRVSPFEETDYQLLFDLHSDPEVNRYLSPGPVPMVADEVRQRLETYIGDHRRTGISKWKLETHNGEFVGRAGFAWPKALAAYELGYSLKRKAWGRGYATEIAQALVRWFYERTDENVLMAYAVSKHRASRAVMEKVGFRFWQDRENHGQPCSYYRLEREDYEHGFVKVQSIK